MKHRNVKITSMPNPQFVGGLITKGYDPKDGTPCVVYIPVMQVWHGDVRAVGIDLMSLEEEFDTIWEAPHA